jgi:hypothetical protein
MAIALSVSFALGAGLSACNVFAPFDNPTSDTQLLSAARACFDQGDLPCAKEYYSRVSSANSDSANSERILATLSEQGATMSALIEFVGNQANGRALTRFAERLSSGSGETRRLAIYNAFKDHTLITNSSLKAFVKFVSALSLAAEILGEAANSDGILHKTDLVADLTCSKDLLTNNPATTACDAPAAGNIEGSSTGDILTNTPSGAKPNYDQLYWAIEYAYNALQELQAGGDFGNTSTNLLEVLNETGGNAPSQAGVAFQKAFRAQLVGTDGFNIGN